VTFLISWLPHVLVIFFEEFYGKSIISHIIPLLACKSTLMLTPLMIYLLDRRLHISYLRSDIKDLTIDAYPRNNETILRNMELIARVFE